MYRMQQLKNAYRKPEARFSLLFLKIRALIEEIPPWERIFLPLLLGSRWYRAIRSFGWDTRRQRIGFTSVSASLSLFLSPSRFLIVNRRITKRGLASCLSHRAREHRGFRHAPILTKDTRVCSRRVWEGLLRNRWDSIGTKIDIVDHRALYVTHTLYTLDSHALCAACSVQWMEVECVVPAQGSLRPFALPRNAGLSHKL